MLLFRSEEHVHRWCKQHELSFGGTMTPEQGWRLAYEWFKDKTKPEWRRRTPDETRELFHRIGLTGEFWEI